jgi:hypothetical protein
MENARRFKNIDYATADFLREQLTMTGPVNALVWLAGLGALFLLPPFKPYRALGVAYLAILAVMLSTAAKPYYLSPAYAVLWAAGAAAIERATFGWKSRGLYRGALVVLVVASSLVLAPLARPILPVESYVRYAAALGQAPGSDERHELGRLPQFFADMQEWRGMAEAVAATNAKLSPEERAAACAFGQNYGEAGTVEYFGAELGLPPVLSGHNSWHLWGPQACTAATTFLVIDRDRDDLAELFDSVEAGAVFDCRDCMPYEDGLTVWIARGARVGLVELWPRLRHFS